MFANTSEPKQTAVDNNEIYTDTELEPLRSEVEWAINSLKDRKSPGCDEITAEMIKASGEAGITYYHKICTKYGRQGNGQKNGNEQCLLYYLKRRPSAMFKSQNNLAN